MTRPPWLTPMLAALRATGSMVEARKVANVSAREVTEACNADDALAGELETARQVGLRAKRGGAGGQGENDRRVPSATGAGEAAEPRRGVDSGGDREGPATVAPMVRAKRYTGATRGASDAALTSEDRGPTGRAVHRILSDATNGPIGLIDFSPMSGATLTPPAEWAPAVAASQAREAEERTVATPEPKRGPATRADGEVDIRATLQAFRDEAARVHGPGLFGLLLHQENALVAAGFHPISPWWLFAVAAFLAILKRWMLILAGRGAGKSTMLTRLAVVLALFSPRRIPPGQTWIWPFVSVRPGDARKRLEEIRAILLHAYHYELKITTAESTPTLALEDAAGQSIAFVSFASTLGNVSGPNSIGATVDEEEKLERSPAEVVGSLAQTFRARPGIRGIRCSSVFKADGTLVRAIDKGDSLTNFIARIGEQFLPDVLAGLEAVAAWEEGRGDRRAAERIRAHASTLTAESASIPTWLGNPSTGAPEDGGEWTAAQAAVATRIEVEAADERILDGLTRADYWLRENASVVPWGGAGLSDDDFEIVGEPRRYSEETPEERDYG